MTIGTGWRSRRARWWAASLFIGGLLGGCIAPFPEVGPVGQAGMDGSVDRGLDPDAARADMPRTTDATLDARAVDRGRPADGSMIDADLSLDMAPFDRGALEDATPRPLDAMSPADDGPLADAAIIDAAVIDAEPAPDQRVPDAAPPPECPLGDDWDRAEGGFCVRIQPIQPPAGWTGMWAHGAARMSDNAVRIAGGAVGDVATAATWLFANDTLVAAPDLNRETRSFATLLRRDGQLFLFMGDRDGGAINAGVRPTNRTHRWNRVEALWDENPPARISVERSSAAATQLRAPDGRVVVAGGYVDGAPRVEVDLFADEAWTDAPPLMIARAAAHLITLPPPGQRVMAFGGVGLNGPIFAPEIIDLAAQEPRWIGLDHRIQAPEHAFAAIATTPDGRTYVTGGLAANGVASGLFLAFSPEDTRWTRLPDLPAAVARHTLTALPDGRLVLMGGHRANGTATDQVRVYEPGEGWLSSRPMTAVRQQHTATLLADGRILVVGGYNPLTEAAVAPIEVHTIRPR